MNTTQHRNFVACITYGLAAAALFAVLGSNLPPAYGVLPPAEASEGPRSLNADLLDAIGALASAEPVSGTAQSWLSTVGALRKISDSAAVAILAAYRVRGLTATEAGLATLTLRMATRRLASACAAARGAVGTPSTSDGAALTATQEAVQTVLGSNWLRAAQRDRASAAAAALVHGLLAAQDLVADRAPGDDRVRSRRDALDSLDIAAELFEQIGDRGTAARALLLSAALTISPPAQVDRAAPLGLAARIRGAARIRAATSLGLDDAQQASATAMSALIDANSTVRNSGDPEAGPIVLDGLIDELLRIPRATGVTRRTTVWRAVLVGAVRQRVASGCAAPAKSTRALDLASTIVEGALQPAPADIESTLLSDASPGAAMEVLRAMADHERVCAVERSLPLHLASALDALHASGMIHIAESASHVTRPHSAAQPPRPVDWRLAEVREDFRKLRATVPSGLAPGFAAALRAIVSVTSKRCGLDVRPVADAALRSASLECGSVSPPELATLMLRTADAVAPTAAIQLAEYLEVSSSGWQRERRGSVWATVFFIVDPGDRELAAVAPKGLELAAEEPSAGTLSMLQPASYALRTLLTTAGRLKRVVALEVALPAGFFLAQPVGDADRGGSAGVLFKVPEERGDVVFRVRASRGRLVVDRLRNLADAWPFERASVRPWLFERPTASEIAELDQRP